MGAAWTTLICYASMAVISYVWGQQHFRVPYNVSRVLLYMAGAVALWWGVSLLDSARSDTPLLEALSYALKGLVLGAFVLLAWKLERPLAQR